MVDVNTQFGGFLTNQGAAKKTNCDALGQPWKLTHMLLGDANGADPVPNPGQTQLVHQVYRAQLNQLYVSPVDPNVLIAELVLPPNVGGFWVRELALEDEDGVFSAAANCAPSYKPVLAQGSGRNQVVRMHILTSGTANIQLKIDPSVVLATRAYCDALMAAHLAAADPHPQYQLRGAITSLGANTQLTAAHEGLLLLSAAVGNRTYTLPAANAALGVRELVLRRTDVTTNVLLIAAFGTDKLQLNTTAEAEGQASSELLFAGDYLRLRSDGAGKWWVVGQAQLPGSIASGLVVFTAGGNYAFTVPPVFRSGRRRPTVTVVGGGGGAGSGGGSFNRVGGGGGAGGASIKQVDLNGITSVLVTVGSGGVGAATGSTAASGGASSFGSYCSATGGAGASDQISGGLGGAGTGGDMNIGGGSGLDGLDAATSSGAQGSGGNSIFGGAARSGTAMGSIRYGSAPGAGGGSISGTSAGSGGNGAPGVVIIQW